MDKADEAFLDATHDAILARLGDGSIFSLPWSEQVVAIVFGAQGIIDNGGFEYFFGCDWIDQPPYSVFADAYRAIGADECAEYIEVAIGLFPFANPHLSQAARLAYLSEHCVRGAPSTIVSLGDQIIDRSDTNFLLLARYVRAHADEILAA